MSSQESASAPESHRGGGQDKLTLRRLAGLIVVCFGRFWVHDLPFSKAPGTPISVEEHTSMAPKPAAKVRILRFKNLPPSRHYRGLQNPRLRYSPGLDPTTRLNALLNAASDS
jgi:hypothetical protein